MKRVLLFSSHTDRLKVTIEAYFDEKDNLVIEGYDIGETAKEFWGDIDYEYTTTVSPEEVKKLYILFSLTKDSRDDLLSLIQSKYNTNSCYSEFSSFLEKNNIKSVGFSWR